MKITIEFYMFKLIQILNFNFNKQVWFLEEMSEKKYTYGRKHKKMKITIEFFIFELV